MYDLLNLGYICNSTPDSYYSQIIWGVVPQLIAHDGN